MASGRAFLKIGGIDSLGNDKQFVCNILTKIENLIPFIKYIKVNGPSVDGSSWIIWIYGPVTLDNAMMDKIHSIFIQDGGVSPINQIYFDPTKSLINEGVDYTGAVILSISKPKQSVLLSSMHTNADWPHPIQNNDDSKILKNRQNDLLYQRNDSLPLGKKMNKRKKKKNKKTFIDWMMNKLLGVTEEDVIERTSVVLDDFD